MEQSSQHIRSCYDAVAREYADRYSHELDHKPMDRELLARFAAEVGSEGEVYDLGCGPGETTAFLHGCGLRVRGLDLSEELLNQARRRHPNIAFEAGDMLELRAADGALGGVVAFYSIVHFSTAQLRLAFAEMRRVLRPGAQLLLAFHIGQETLHREEFLGQAMSLDFTFFQPCNIEAELIRAGFRDVEIMERDPYPEVEYPSRRAYVFART